MALTEEELRKRRSERARIRTANNPLSGELSRIYANTRYYRLKDDPVVREKLKEQKRQYYWRNRDRILSRMKGKREETGNAYMKQWRAENTGFVPDVLNGDFLNG